MTAVAEKEFLSQNIGLGLADSTICESEICFIDGNEGMEQQQTYPSPS
jgi:hypothetical protein